MAPRRGHISQKTKLVAALCQLKHADESGQLVPVISHEEAKSLTEDEILAKFEWDHNVHFAIGGACQHWNLTPTPKAQHRQKTAKQDIPQIAKTRRLEKAQEDFRRKVLAKTGQITEKEETKQKAKIKSRGFQQWRNFKGEIVKRKG
jgi:hypothetical protein